MRVILLGRLADLGGADQLGIPGPLDWAALLTALPSGLAEEVSGDRVKIALDGVVLAEKASLHAPDGAEVALLPPVSGG